jgi:phage protein D
MLTESILPSLMPNADLVSRKVLVDGNEVPGKYQFITITVQYEINRIPTATLLLSDCSEKKEDFTIASIDDFKPGKKIEIQLGYHNSNETVFKGIIVKNSPRVTGQCVEMTIECKDETVKMTVAKTNHYFTDMKDSDIVNEMLDSNGITDKEILETNIKHEQLVQQNLSDWDFMISRVDVNGAMCLIDNGKLIVRKPELEASAKLSLTHGASILEFNADMDSRIQSDKVIVYSWI